MLVQENPLNRANWTDSSNCKGQKIERVGWDSRPPAVHSLGASRAGAQAGQALFFRQVVLCVTKGQLCLFSDLITLAVGVTVIAQFL